MQQQPLDYAVPGHTSLWRELWPVIKWILIVIGLIVGSVVLWVLALLVHVWSFGGIQGG